jgi:hypothetical protein
MKVNYLRSLMLQIFLGTIISATAANTIAAQDYTAQVRQQLDRLQSALQGRGYKETHDRKYGRINVSAVESYRVTLRQGWEYVFYGACDEDCSDLDIIIYDSNNNEVAKDNDNSDVPIVRIAPNRTGEYHIRVRMYRCSTNPCVYGVGTVGK